MVEGALEPNDLREQDAVSKLKLRCCDRINSVSMESQASEDVGLRAYGQKLTVVRASYVVIYM